jgi:endo-1,4-beta-xylanase
MFMILAVPVSCRFLSPRPVDKIESLQSVSTFPVGVAVGEDLFKNNPAYRGVVLNEYGSLTPENAGKIESLHPRENLFDFSGLDSIVDFARRNSKRVHGTTLIWHEFSDLEWVKSFRGDSAAWEQMFKTHIQTVVRHFRGRIRSWDVVNEPFHEDGSLRTAEAAEGGNPGSIWARHLGRDYIARVDGPYVGSQRIGFRLEKGHEPGFYSRIAKKPIGQIPVIGSEL